MLARDVDLDGMIDRVYATRRNPNINGQVTIFDSDGAFSGEIFIANPVFENGSELG